MSGSARCLTLCLVGTLLLPGCITPRWRLEETIHRSDNLIVEIEEWTGESGDERPVSFAHPCEIPPELIQSCFGQLRYRSSRLFKDESLRPVVAPALAATLSVEIFRGLDRAGPRQRVRFRAQFRDASLAGVLTTESVTRGVAFVEPEGSLNLVFDLVGIARDRTRRADPLDEQWEDPTRRSGSRTSLVIEGDGRFHRNDQGREHPLWVVFALP